MKFEIHHRNSSIIFDNETLNEHFKETGEDLYDLLQDPDFSTLVSENKGVGSYTINWDGTNNNGVTVSAGMYLYKINTENYVETKKMLLVK